VCSSGAQEQDTCQELEEKDYLLLGLNADRKRSKDGK
jgi:hypothetical protein